MHLYILASLVCVRVWMHFYVHTRFARVCEFVYTHSLRSCVYVYIAMAGHAAKKTARNAETQSVYYFWVFISGFLLNVIVRVGLFLDVSLSSVFQMMFLGGVGWMCLGMIRNSLHLGVGFSYWQDLFIINFTVQTLSLISSYFWIIYLTVPGYAVFKFGKQIVDYVFTPRETDVVENPRASRPVRR